MLDRSGKTVIPETEIFFPDAFHVEISAVTADSAGSLYASAQVWSTGKSGTGIICKVSPGSPTILVMRTDDFLARALAVTGEGDIWAFGLPLLLQTEKRSTIEYMTLWHLDPSGKVLERMLPRSGFGADVMPTNGSGEIGGPHLWATSTRLGVYSATGRRWIEFDLQRHEKKLDVTVGPPAGADGTTATLAEVVMTNSHNEVYAFFTYQNIDVAHRPGLYQLDKAAAHWTLIYQRSSLADFSGLFGAEGDDLILRSGPSTFGWIPSSAFGKGPIQPTVR
jgi:hypothetical protein